MSSTRKGLQAFGPLGLTSPRHSGQQAVAFPIRVPLDPWSFTVGIPDTPGGVSGVPYSSQCIESLHKNILYICLIPEKPSRIPVPEMCLGSCGMASPWSPSIACQSPGLKGSCGACLYQWKRGWA